MPVEYILNLYTRRRPVEVFFRTAKGKLALDKYQLRSATGIRRFWLVMSLTHFLYCVGSGILRSFSEGYAYWQKLVLHNVVQCVYNCGKNGMLLAMLGMGYLSAFSQICTFTVFSFDLELWISLIDISRPFSYNILYKWSIF